MGSASIWTVEERKMRFGRDISETSLHILWEKRARQCVRLLKKYENVRKVYWKLSKRFNNFIKGGTGQ
jgi:hypothetical protein